MLNIVWRGIKTQLRPLFNDTVSLCSTNNFYHGILIILFFFFRLKIYFIIVFLFVTFFMSEHRYLQINFLIEI